MSVESLAQANSLTIVLLQVRFRQGDDLNMLVYRFYDEKPDPGFKGDNFVSTASISPKRYAVHVIHGGKGVPHQSSLSATSSSGPHHLWRATNLTNRHRRRVSNGGTPTRVTSGLDVASGK